MCFSAEADLIAGVVVGGVGVDALRHVRNHRELAVAALPVVFGAHQLIETVVWWGADGRASRCVADTAASIYLVIAFLLPLAVPLAVLAMETDRGSRRTMAACAVLGGVVSAVLLSDLADGGVVVHAADLHLSYDLGLDGGGALAVLYVAATCVPMLASSHRRLVAFGVLNLAAVVVLGWLLTSGFISLWCAWAAVTSAVIAVYMRKMARQGISHRASGIGYRDPRASGSCCRL